MTLSSQALNLKKPIIIIPAYQPDEQLLFLVRRLLKDNPNQSIIIVNDGSTDDSLNIFKQLENLPNVTLIHHAVNLGKGQALKTAFSYFLNHFSADYAGAVTADADGQHTVDDILHVAKCLETASDTLWLGSRKLNTSVPWRSRFGNNLTRKIFKLFAGKPISDTQTGLRGIPRSFMAELLKIPGSGYEFELDMLLQATSANIPVQEVTIKTVYIDHNKSSHFNPLVDSLKIYFVFLRYSIVAILSACLDFLLFSLGYLLSQNILGSLLFGRILSGTFNFLMCRKVIFKSNNHITLEALKYVFNAIVAVALSYLLLKAMVDFLNMNVYFSKILADFCIFLFNFTVQRLFIFIKK